MPGQTRLIRKSASSRSEAEMAMPQQDLFAVSLLWLSVCADHFGLRCTYRKRL